MRMHSCPTALQTPNKNDYYYHYSSINLESRYAGECTHKDTTLHLNEYLQYEYNLRNAKKRHGSLWETSEHICKGTQLTYTKYHNNETFTNIKENPQADRISPKSCKPLKSKRVFLMPLVSLSSHGRSKNIRLGKEHCGREVLSMNVLCGGIEMNVLLLHSCLVIDLYGCLQFLVNFIDYCLYKP